MDFSRFHVACLSGRNGQGKSALLDALTWALWGEARKSSGAQKPDEELLRIGSRRMYVEFLFDIEGDRYRVLRTYSRSATGKTSKSVLELQLIKNNEEENGIPLTKASMRETQEALNERLGLDYDAFVNSALLLQGRSDEFTKKKPAERKNILGRVLNLAKYDRLADRTRIKQSALKTEVEKLDREVEIFSDLLKNETKWVSDFEAVNQELGVREKALSDLRAEEAVLVEKVVSLQSLQKELDSLNVSLYQATNQRELRVKEKDEISLKINRAHKLIENKEQIQQDYQAYVSYQKERDELDTQREVYRGIEAQLQSARSALIVKRTELESKIDKLELEIRVKEQEYKAAEIEVASKEELLSKLDTSRKAGDRVLEIEALIEKRKSLDVDIKELEQHVFGKKKQLLERYDGLKKQLAKVKPRVDEISRLKASLREVKANKEQLVRIQANLVKTKEDGLAIAGEIGQVEVRISVVKEEEEKITRKIEQFNEAGELKCPTCGTALKRNQRERLVSELEVQLGDIKNDLKGLSALLVEHEKKRDALRDSYKELANKEQHLSNAVELYHELNQRIAKSVEIKEEYEADEKKLADLYNQLESNEYAVDEQKSLLEKTEQRKGLMLQEEDLNDLRFRAAQIERFGERLRKIEISEGKKETLHDQIKNNHQALEDLRNQFDSGAAYGEFKDKIAHLEQKLIKSDFDPERFELIKKSIKERSEAPEMVRALHEAENNVIEWVGQRENLEKILAEVNNTITLYTETKASTMKALAELEGLQVQLDRKRTERKEAEEKVLASQQAIGELNAKMEQVNQAKKKRKDAKDQLKVKRKELNIYRKLRTAFGKNGIQSLIIEQSLPEIEERASEILHRLTDGKMQVHLETIKDKKSGGTKETLEIIITDDSGIPRAYETYSGGEAFRINFALRIALAQMLAERNGVKIRTLGIDEGFGTQDEDGIQYLIEAIQKVQDDFDKIIVITHLNRLKEAFPVRIEVVKDPIRGSEFTLIEQ